MVSLRSVPAPLAYDVKSAAAAVSLSASKLEEQIKAKKLAVKWVDGKRVIPATELLAWLESRPDEKATA